MNEQEMRDRLEWQLNLVAFEFQDLDFEDAKAILKKVWASWKRQKQKDPDSENLLRAS
jgi:hypothetical protein